MKGGKTSEGQKKIYEMVTNNIIKRLEEGNIPWRNIYNNAIFPMSIHKKRYSGINRLLLSMIQTEIPEFTNLWITYLQCKKLGGYVKKGEKSAQVVFFNYSMTVTCSKCGTKEYINSSKEPKDFNVEGIHYVCKKCGIMADVKKFPLLAYYNVFNLAQTTLDISKYLPKNQTEHEDTNIIERVEAIVTGMPHPPYRKEIGMPPANYNPATDTVSIPPLKVWATVEQYGCGILHEYAHSTGHESRLNRKGITAGFEKTIHDYSLEELVAEITVCFIAQSKNIQLEFIDQVDYIRNWLQKLKDNHGWIVIASSMAEKAADYILNQKG